MYKNIGNRLSSYTQLSGLSIKTSDLEASPAGDGSVFHRKRHTIANILSLSFNLERVPPRVGLEPVTKRSVG